MAFEELEKFMERMKKVTKQFGPEKSTAVEIWESIPRYNEQQVVELTKLSNKIQMGCTDEERPALIREFARLRDQVELRENAPEKIYLWPEGNMPAETEYTDNSEYRYNHAPDFKPYLLEMLLPEDVTPKGAVVLCAGGDHAEAVVHEGYQSAKDLNQKGYQCFLLLNRTNHNPWNGHECGADGARAIRFVRANAAKYRVKPDQVAFAGFSNGGLTGEAVIENYSGDKKVTDYFPGYVPDELDQYYGAPDAFLCVYGPRFNGGTFNWEGVAYPPTFFAVGCEDTAMDNLHYVYPDLVAHGVPVEVHTFAGVPHGKAGASILGDNYENFDLWVTLADHFLQQTFSKKEK